MCTAAFLKAAFTVFFVCFVLFRSLPMALITDKIFLVKLAYGIMPVAEETTGDECVWSGAGLS